MPMRAIVAGMSALRALRVPRLSSPCAARCINCAERGDSRSMSLVEGSSDTRDDTVEALSQLGSH